MLHLDEWASTEHIYVVSQLFGFNRWHQDQGIDIALTDL